VTRTELQAGVAARLGSPAEARWLLEDVLGPPGPTGPDADQVQRIAGLVERRRQGEPLQYLLGHWAFRHLDLVVDPRVLIPRPETEQLVDVALAELARLAPGRPDPDADGPSVVDLGTGSGAIALALATEGARRWPGLRVRATDASSDALAVATANRQRVVGRWPEAGRVELARGWWWDAVPAEDRGRVDLVVANPPYVTEAEWGGLDAEVRAEPRTALVAGPGRHGQPGLADVEAVLDGAGGYLRRPGTAVVEIAPTQSGLAAAAARAAGAAKAHVQRDLTGRERILVARWR
jgi:release factor glutamine methyltransferase